MSPVAILVGAPGAGKSTVGRALAKALGVTFRDTDADIEAAAGSTIGDIFINHGEEHFRALETAAIARAIAEHDGVLALGGGAVMRAENRSLLAGVPVVWLEISLAEAVKRVGMNQARPLLLGNVRGRMMSLLEERTPIYEAVADHRVKTDNRSIDEVVTTVIAALGVSHD